MYSSASNILLEFVGGRAPYLLGLLGSGSARPPPPRSASGIKFEGYYEKMSPISSPEKHITQINYSVPGSSSRFDSVKTTNQSTRNTTYFCFDDMLDMNPFDGPLLHRSSKGDVSYFKNFVRSSAFHNVDLRLQGTIELKYRM